MRSRSARARLLFASSASEFGDDAALFLRRSQWNSAGLEIRQIDAQTADAVALFYE